MKISEIKKRMLAYEDFYGGDLFDKQAIEDATTRKQLADVLENHRHHMENMLCDAKSHLDNFKNKVGLSCL